MVLANKEINQGKKIVISEICPNTYENLVYDKGSSQLSWGEKMRFFSVNTVEGQLSRFY